MYKKLVFKKFQFSLNKRFLEISELAQPQLEMFERAQPQLEKSKRAQPQLEKSERAQFY